MFDLITNNKCEKLTKQINRSVRNADAHLNFIYDHITNEFIIRKKKNGKIVNEKHEIINLLINHYVANQLNAEQKLNFKILTEI